MANLLFVVHLAVTWALVGLIWTIHLVHYPVFALATGPSFRAVHEHHMARITFLVGPLMLVELATAVWLWREPPPGTGGGGWWLALLLLVVFIWVDTALLAAPAHGRFERGFDAGAHALLMRADLARALAWTVRGGLLVWIAARALPS